jgi:hypothetical protein
MAGETVRCEHSVEPANAGFRWCCWGLAQIIIEALEGDLALAQADAVRTGSVADHFRVDSARRAIETTVHAANRCGQRVESVRL